MSGGSWDYAYTHLNDVIDSLERDTTPNHYTLDLTEDQKSARAYLASHLKLVADALHDVEWVDSCDYGPGDELEAIEKLGWKR